MYSPILKAWKTNYNSSENVLILGLFSSLKVEVEKISPYFQKVVICGRSDHGNNQKQLSLFPSRLLFLFVQKEDFFSVQIFFFIGEKNHAFLPFHRKQKSPSSRKIRHTKHRNSGAARKIEFISLSLSYSLEFPWKFNILLGMHFLPFLSASKEVKRLLYSYEHTAKGPLSTGPSKDRCKLVGSRWVHVQPNLCPMYRTQVSIPMDPTMEPETTINLAQKKGN